MPNTLPSEYAAVAKAAAEQAIASQPPPDLWHQIATNPLLALLFGFLLSKSFERHKELFSTAHKNKEDIAIKFMTYFDECDNIDRDGLFNDDSKVKFKAALENLTYEYQRSLLYFHYNGTRNEFRRSHIHMCMVCALNRISTEGDPDRTAESLNELRGDRHMHKTEWNKRLQSELSPGEPLMFFRNLGWNIESKLRRRKMSKADQSLEGAKKKSQPPINR